jgi:antitoxin MazE
MIRCGKKESGGAMFTQVQKWGNSLAIRLPKAFAEELAWNQETRVKETIIDGKLVIEAVQPPVYTLEQLLEGVTENSLHGEISSGPAVGKESW